MRHFLNSKRPVQFLTAIITFAFLMILFTSKSTIAADKKPPAKKCKAKETPAKTEQFILGPYSLGDLYKVDTCNRFSNIGGRGLGPSEKSVIQALNSCQIYILDKREMKKNGIWKFTYSDDYPKVLIAGKLRHVLKDSKGRDFTLQITEVKKYFTGTIHRSLETQFKLSTRKIRFAAYIEIETKMLEKYKFKSINHEMAFKKISVSYYADGKTRAIDDTER